MPTATILDRVGDIQGGNSFIPVIKTLYHMVLQDHLKYWISTTTKPMAIKLGKMAIKSQNPLNMCSHEVKW